MTQQEQQTRRPSLADVVRFAMTRPSLRAYTPEQLAALYYEYIPSTFAFCDQTGRLRGAAIAHDTSEDTVRIVHICHDGGSEIMAAMVDTLRSTWPAAKWLTFRRRNKEMKFSINNLGRLLEISYGRHA